MATRFARRCLPLVTRTYVPVHTILRAHTKFVTSVRYAQTRATSPAQRRPADTETYDISAVPFADFKAAIDMAPERFDLKSAQEYYELLTEYSGPLAAGKTPRSSRISDERFSAEILHDLGSILRSLPRQSKQSQGLLLQVWSHAAELGFTPSLLSLCLFTAHAKGWGKLHWLKKYESQFKKLAADGKDPNVLFVEASLQSGQGNQVGAAKLLERARQINDADYEWRPTAELLLARTYIELGRKQEAIEVLLPLVETKWNDAEYELGKLMRETGGDMEEARQYIYQSTRSGQYERCALLAEMASEAAEHATDDASKEEHRRWAVEWSRLANHHAQM